MTSSIDHIATLSTHVVASLLALNNAHQKETSFLSDDDWKHLVSEAYTATAIGAGGFLITFNQDADYDSPNFIWFKKQYSDFVYVDRIVVSKVTRGQGIAKRLYENLFDVARQKGHSRVVCEVNIDPPNPGSDAFHDKLGFHEIGQAQLKDRGKTVRYLCKNI